MRKTKVLIQKSAYFALPDIGYLTSGFNIANDAMLTLTGIAVFLSKIIPNLISAKRYKLRFNH